MIMLIKTFAAVVAGTMVLATNALAQSTTQVHDASPYDVTGNIVRVGGGL
jgi:hypothetical protein